jgi:hypothetical protein
MALRVSKTRVPPFGNLPRRSSHRSVRARRGGNGSRTSRAHHGRAIPIGIEPKEGHRRHVDRRERRLENALMHMTPRCGQTHARHGGRELFTRSGAIVGMNRAAAMLMCYWRFGPPMSAGRPPCHRATYHAWIGEVLVGKVEISEVRVATDKSRVAEAAPDRVIARSMAQRSPRTLPRWLAPRVTWRAALNRHHTRTIIGRRNRWSGRSSLSCLSYRQTYGQSSGEDI